MTVYIDIIFFENLIMNLSIILSEKIILNRKNSMVRNIVSSIVGAFGSVLEIIFPSMYIKFVIPFFMIFIAFKWFDIQNFMKEIIVFYFISFVYGGIAFALLNLNSQKINIVNGVIVGKYNLIFVFSSVVIGFSILIFILKEKQRKTLKNISIKFEEYEFNINVFFDTGNLLREPYTGKPVIIVEKDSINELICEKCEDNFEKIIKGESEVPLNMFLIPFRTIGNSNGFLLGIKPLYVEDKNSGKKYTDIIIGICNEKISETNEYSGIFGLKTLEEGICNV